VAPRGFDPKAQAGKVPPPARRVEVLVIGAGPAGVAAALEARSGGAHVLLIDENPVSAGLMGLDVPHYYGGRQGGAVQAKTRMMEQVFAANPALERAFEAGVEIELGVYCWGAWVPGYGLASLPEPLAGLADDERSWMVGFERLILATGARDVAFSFTGWDQPGVMGARALRALLDTYDAFAGRRLVILGSGDLALTTARRAIDRGLEVVALIEVEDRIQGDPDRLVPGVAVRTGHAPVCAEGGANGVERLTVRDLASGVDLILDCDTVIEAISLTPVIELLEVLGADLVMRADLGGWAPASPDGVSTSLPAVQVAGEVAGAGDSAPRDLLAYQQTWMRALMAVTDASVVVCQCETVSREALLAVRQPDYLGSPSAGMTERDLGRLLEDGPVSQDQIKRLTRACMGPCQARRCREQVALILACASNTPPAEVPLAGYRAPVRPLPLSVLAAWDEDPLMAGHWDVWFGIKGQWTPYADIGTEREALYDGLFGGDMHL
jgi:NADPH-dependent 2,4-dienoyl-CoA reductase/sulfur reductase-like enzyme